MKLIDLVPLKEGSMQARELASRNKLHQLEKMRDELLKDMNHEAGQMGQDEFEKEGRHDYYGDQLNDIDAAIALKQPKKDVPYDVAVGKMTQGEYDKHMSTVAKDRASFEKSSKFDRMNEDKELDPYQKSIAAKWDKESKKLGGGLFDTSRELEKTDTKQFNINVNNKLEFLTDLNNAGKFRKKGGYSDDQIENWTINPSVTGYGIASKLKPEANEGSCGYGPDGVPGDTPGETQGMDADDRTRIMLRMLIQKEIAKLSETK